MVPAAPRYDPLVLAAIAELDDRRETIAEVCRRVGTVAEALGFPRPSYVHVRRHVLANRAREDVERERRAAVRRVLADAATAVVVGRFVHPYELADRLETTKAVVRGSELQTPAQGGQP